jgi:hypothetical protein
METLPPRGAHANELPFRATQSEQRIIKELLSVMALRGGDISQWKNADFLSSRNIRTAADCIDALRAELFPQEAELRRQRTEALRPLNGGPVRTHFDQSLETSALTIHATIHSKTDFEMLLKRLMAFDFDGWREACESERINAD